MRGCRFGDDECVTGGDGVSRRPEIAFERQLSPKWRIIKNRIIYIMKNNDDVF